MEMPNLHPRSTQSGTLHVPLPPAQAFDLFTAEGERLWAPGWDPEILSETVFLTGHGGEETIWTIIEADRAAGRLCYARISPGVRAGTVRVQLSAEGTGSRVEVSYDMTSLGPRGVEPVTKMDRDGFTTMLRDWEKFIGDALVATASQR
jgi:hypothetical protein